MLQKQKAVTVASLMMLINLAVWLFSSLYAARWADFLSIIGCVLPLFMVRGRGTTFGTTDCNVRKYKRKQYVPIFVFCVSGCALISFVTALISPIAGVAQGRGDFMYVLVFACLLPAFFEELLLRGGVLGALAQNGAGGILLCGIMFGLMHISPRRIVYAAFAGIVISALVYLTECIYLGILLHLANNLFSLALGSVQSVPTSFVIAGVLAVMCVSSFLFLKNGKLYADFIRLFSDFRIRDFFKTLTPAFWIYAVATLAIGILTV